MTRTLKEKVEKELQIKDYYNFQGRVYFLSSNGYPVYLPESYYFKRKEELRNYFSDREENERNRLVLENLSLFAKEIPDKEYHKTTTLAYESNAVRAWITKNYSPEEDWMPNREDKLSDLREIDVNPWDTTSERNSKYWVFARKIRDKLRKELVGN